jgi:hypothetical protein
MLPICHLICCVPCRLLGSGPTTTTSLFLLVHLHNKSGQSYPPVRTLPIQAIAICRHVLDGSPAHVSGKHSFVAAACRTMQDRCVIPDEHVAFLNPVDGNTIPRSTSQWPSKDPDTNRIDLLGFRYVAYQLLYEFMALGRVHIFYMVHITGNIKVLQSQSA